MGDDLSPQDEPSPTQPTGQAPPAHQGRFRRARNRVSGWWPGWKTVLAASGALLSVVASVAAATAAWLSWQAAKESAQIAREQEVLSRDVAARSGVYLGVNNAIELGGRCDESNPNNNTLVAYVLVYNLGLVAGRVEGATLGVDVPPNLESKINHPGEPVVANVAWKVGKTTVPPQDSVLITLDFMCSALPGIGIDPARAVEQITGSINKHVLRWKLWPMWAFNPNTAQSPVVDVVSAGTA